MASSPPRAEISLIKFLKVIFECCPDRTLKAKSVLMPEKCRKNSIDKNYSNSPLIELT